MLQSLWSLWLCVSCCRITFSGLTCTDMYVGWYEASMSATQPLTVIMSTLLGLISSSMILRDRGGGMMEGQDLVVFWTRKYLHPPGNINWFQGTFREIWWNTRGLNMWWPRMVSRWSSSKAHHAMEMGISSGQNHPPTWIRCQSIPR